jgi:hypothetical protein
MIVVLFATLLNFTLNVYAIPRYGTTGAAVVSLITNLFIGAGYIVSARSFFGGWQINLKTIVTFVATALFAMLLWNFRMWSMWYAVPFIITLFGMMFLFLGYSSDERKLVFGMKQLMTTSQG